MLTIQKPSFIESNTISVARVNQYIPFRVRIASTYWNGSEYMLHLGNTIYQGKSFVFPYDNDHGQVRFEVSRLMRDYCWKWETEYDDTKQTYRPVFDEMGLMSISPKPIEIDKNLLYCAGVHVEFGNNMYVEQQSMFTGYDSYNAGHNTRVYNPYNTTTPLETVVFYGQKYTDILPHLPKVHTDNFWFGLQFALTQSSSPSFSLGNASERNNINIDIAEHSVGNYSICLPMHAIMSPLTENRVYFTNTPGHGKTTSYAVAEVDECPSDYYISWMTPYNTWMSQGFNGRKTMTDNAENTVVTDVYDIEHTIHTKRTDSYFVNSGFVNQDMFNLLMTIANSYIVYLYDVKNDYGRYVTVIDTQVTEQYKRRNLQLTLKEIEPVNL